ncbi:MAG: IS3 family transposase [Chloroflexota bacterium]|nr:IS3 family transposase [Chloroflexota bacterium]
MSRSWYYDKPSAEQKAQRDVRLRDAIERIVLEFPGYGYRRVTEQLHREEWYVNHKRVLRVMRQESLLCQLKKRFVITTDSAHDHRTYPNLLDGSVLDSLNSAWVAEIISTQMIKTDVLAAGAGREHVSDLHIAVGDDHPVYQ